MNKKTITDNKFKPGSCLNVSRMVYPFLLLVFFCFSYSSEKTDVSPILYAKGMGYNRVVVQILDENYAPTAARIRVTAHDSIYYAPEGHLADFLIDTSGGDALLDNNRRFAYVEGTFAINLPAGKMKFEVVKGFTYRFYDSTIQIGDQTDTVKIQLQKFFEFTGEKWFGGDIHVHHIDPATALLEMKAEDLNVCNILTSDFTNDTDRFSGAPDSISDSLHLVYVNQEYREDWLGHVNLLNLTGLIEPVKPMRRHQYPLNIQAADKTHEQGGHVSWAHFAAWPGLESPLAIVLKKIDAVELLCTIDPFSDPIFAIDVVPDLQMNSGLKLWYRLLNCGLKIPASAGTDKMSKRVTVGANRVYAQVSGEFTYQNWIEALNRGNSFITNSPLLFCKVENKNPGELINIPKGEKIAISTEMWSQLPVDRLEILANGEVIAVKKIEKGQHHAKLEIEYKPAKSVWIAARVHQLKQEEGVKGVSYYRRRDFGSGSTLLNRYFGTLRPEIPFAHTSPIYITVQRRPIRSKDDAKYFIQYLNNSISWLKESGSFPSPQAKLEVIKAFEQGVNEFKKLAK